MDDTVFLTLCLLNTRVAVPYRTDPRHKLRTPEEAQLPPGANQRAARGSWGLSLVRTVGRMRQGIGAGLRR